jgi:hypothetical protein
MHFINSWAPGSAFLLLAFITAAAFWLAERMDARVVAVPFLLLLDDRQRAGATAIRLFRPPPRRSPISQRFYYFRAIDRFRHWA